MADKDKNVINACLHKFARTNVQSSQVDLLAKSESESVAVVSVGVTTSGVFFLNSEH